MSSTLAVTTSAPSLASAFAFSVVASRVMARAVKGPFLSAQMARTRPPPWAPVAPTTAMICLLDMNPPPGSRCGWVETASYSVPENDSAADGPRARGEAVQDRRREESAGDRQDLRPRRREEHSGQRGDGGDRDGVADCRAERASRGSRAPVEPDRGGAARDVQEDRGDARKDDERLEGSREGQEARDDRVDRDGDVRDARSRVHGAQRPRKDPRAAEGEEDPRRSEQVARGPASHRDD